MFHPTEENRFLNDASLRYEELTAEERLLSNEVQALNDKIDLWSTQRAGQGRSESVPAVGSARKFDATNANLLPEIIEYDVSDDGRSDVSN